MLSSLHACLVLRGLQRSKIEGGSVRCIPPYFSSKAQNSTTDMYEQKHDYDITTANGLTADMKTLERYLLVNSL